MVNATWCKINAIEYGKDIDVDVTLFQNISNADMSESELFIERFSQETRMLFGTRTVDITSTLHFIV